MKKNVIYSPDVSVGRKIYLEPCGLSNSFQGKRGRAGHGKLVAKGDKYLPLASTGLEDSEGNEIFEGHILSINGGGKNFPVIYENGAFFVKMTRSRLALREVNERDGILGHALTNPDLVPDSFDVDEYFRLEENNARKC